MVGTAAFVCGMVIGGMFGAVALALVAGDSERPTRESMLGREVMARKYEASDWERYVVVAEGWHGSMCLRRADDMERNGFWMDHRVITDERVRLV